MKLISYGRKNRAPLSVVKEHGPNIELVDVTRWPNPFSVYAMRKLTGKDKAVQDWLMLSHGEHITEWLKKTTDALPLNVSKNYVLAVNCYGGKHRSVAAVEMLAVRLREKGIANVEVEHMELT